MHYAKDAVSVTRDFLHGSFDRITDRVIRPESDFTWRADVPVGTISAADVFQHDEYYKQFTYYATGSTAGVSSSYISPDTTHYPTVDADTIEKKNFIRLLGLGLTFNDDEIRRSARFGTTQNLIKEKMNAFSFHWDSMLNTHSYFGNHNVGDYGLFNNPSATSLPITVGNWATATPDEIIQDVKDAVKSCWDVTQVYCPDTLLLPSSAQPFLSQAYNAGGQTVNLEQHLAVSTYCTTKNLRPLNIRYRAELDDIGLATTGRMVLYENKAESLEVSFSPLVKVNNAESKSATGLITHNYKWAVSSGLKLYRDSTLFYVDGV